MKPDTVIGNAQSWLELFKQLPAMKTKAKGDVFERIIQLYLTTHSEYQKQRFCESFFG